MNNILPLKFFQRKTNIVAKELLGKYLVVKNLKGEQKSLQVNEVEIYDGFKDKASHATKGKTERNKIMFEKGGFIYIYLVYGIHWLLNIVTAEKNYPSAVLIRGAKGFEGPAKLTKFLEIKKNYNEKEAILKNGLWFEDRGFVFKENKIQKLPRVGINYAGDYWKNKKLRYKISI